MHNVSESSSISIFRQRSTYPGVPLRLSYFITGHHAGAKLVKIYTWQQMQSKGSNKKMAIEKLRIIYETQK